MAKKKEKILTAEEQRQNKLNSFLKERTDFCPEPTYFYNIGDRVVIGALEDVYVCGVINNKVYEIDYSSTNNNYGNLIKHKHQKMFVNWYDIRPYNDTEIKSVIQNNDLRLSYSQRHLGDLFSKAYYFGTNFEPEYQREYVWELEDKVALIDSIFNNVDIGKFVFIHKEYGEDYCYEVLDGKQRIRAILDYFENRFSYKGKFFNDLCVRDQNFFEDYPISMAEVRNITKEQVLRYFVKLNKHGKIMDKQQIEKVENMIIELEK